MMTLHDLHEIQEVTIAKLFQFEGKQLVIIRDSDEQKRPTLRWIYEDRYGRMEQSEHFKDESERDLIFDRHTQDSFARMLMKGNTT